MSVRLTLLSPARGVLALLVGSLVVLALALPSIAHAEGAFEESWSGKLGHDEWSCGHCDPGVSFFERMEISKSTSNTYDPCIGPVQYYEGKYHFPYGWLCNKSFFVQWEWAPISAQPAVYNPVNSTITYGAIGYYSS